MPEIGMLRAMWRALETGLRVTLLGHEGGNSGHRQGSLPSGLPRQRSTLPRPDPANLTEKSGIIKLVLN